MTSPRKGPIPGTTGRPLEERFWEKVNKHGPEVRPGLGECWLWTGKAVDGYGTIRVAGKLKKAHRVAWEFAHGPVPEGQFVRHECDVRLCVRHLLLGTREDNAQDALSRGRMKPQKLENNNNARLSKEDVLEIRRRRSAKERKNEVAEAFNISPQQVYNITSGRQWAEVTE